MDIKLTTTGDIDLTTGDLVLLDEIEAITQQVIITLKFFQGEWFLDERIGVPYFQKIFIKNQKLDIVKSLLRRAILSVDGVTDVADMELEFNSSTRKLDVTCSITTTDGPIEFTTLTILDI